MIPTARHVEPWRIPVPVPIRTPRLRLRPPREGDGAELAAAIDESWETLYPWFHDGMGTREVETDPTWQDAVACRGRARFLMRERPAFLALSLDDELVGFVELEPDWRVGRMRLGYWVRASRRRRGHAVEAVGAVTRFAFGALDARLVTVGHALTKVAPTSAARVSYSLGSSRRTNR